MLLGLQRFNLHHSHQNGKAKILPRGDLRLLGEFRHEGRRALRNCFRFPTPRHFLPRHVGHWCGARSGRQPGCGVQEPRGCWTRRPRSSKWNRAVSQWHTIGAFASCFKKLAIGLEPITCCLQGVLMGGGGPGQETASVLYFRAFLRVQGLQGSPLLAALEPRFRRHSPPSGTQWRHRGWRS